MRCKWPRVAGWTCIDCNIAGATLRDSYVSSPLFDDAPDAFIIVDDAKLNAVVVMFRSTYGNAAGWMNNFVAIGASRTVAGRVYTLHSGFSSSYYQGGLRTNLISKLKPILAAKAGRPTIIVAGHSRGGAMAVQAAVDLATDKAAEVGITDPRGQMKLYTFGQPRVGNAAYASLVEATFAERFRIISNADPAPHMMPSALEIVNPSSMLLRLNSDINSIRNSLAAWVVHGLPLNALSFNTQQIQRDNYRHHGITIVWIDYISKGARISKEIVCTTSDDNSACDAERAATNVNSPSVARVNVPPYNFKGFPGASLNRWPLRALLDHGYYMNTDVGNEDCMAMKPPGWWGWKITVRTADALLAGTDSNIFVSWQCGSTAITRSQLVLDCKVSLGEVLSGNLDDVNCFERNDRDMFAFENHIGTASDGTGLVSASSALAACRAAGMKPVVSLRTDGSGLLGGWDLGGAVLEMAYTSGTRDRITTKTWGDCRPSPFPLKFASSGQTRSVTLCEAVPWFKWRLSIGTATAVGAGTDAPIRVSWSCGGVSMTNGAVNVASMCGLFPWCFEFGALNTFTFEYDPGSWGSQTLLRMANNPVPLCIGNVRPVLSIGFTKGSGFFDTSAWDMAGSKLKLVLQYIPPDVTSLWDETTGNQLTRIVTKTFTPCRALGTVAFTSTGTKQFTLC